MKRVKKMVLFLAVLLAVFAVTSQSVMPLHNVSAASASLSKSNLTLGVGQRYTLKVSGISKKITWKTSKSSVASVSSAGMVTAKKEGSAYITAKSGNISLKCKVTVKGNYRQLYKKFLANSSQPYFFLLDINKDGIKELIIGETGGLRQMVYSVRKGNVKKIGELFFSGAGLGDVVYYSPSEKAIYHQWLTHGVGGVGMALYRISGNNLKTVRYAWEGYPNGKHEFYLANDKKVSEKTLKAYVNKYFGTRLSKLKQYKMLKNTVANRNKIK